MISDNLHVGKEGQTQGEKDDFAKLNLTLRVLSGEMARQLREVPI